MALTTIDIDRLKKRILDELKGVSPKDSTGIGVFRIVMYVLSDERFLALTNERLNADTRRTRIAREVR